MSPGKPADECGDWLPAARFIVPRKDWNYT